MILFYTHCQRLWIILLFSVLYANAQETEIEITDFFAKVYLAPNEKSKFIGLAQRGERYQVILLQNTWVRIRFKNAIGWVYSSQVGPVGSSSANTNDSLTATIDTTATVDTTKNTTSTTNTPQDTTGKNVQPIQQQTIAGIESSSSGTNSNKSASAENQQVNSSEKNINTVQQTKPQNWFSKKTLPKLPTIAQDIDDIDDINDTVALYFQVTFGPARVLSYLDPEAPILGMVRKGTLLPLIGEGDSWCKVLYNDSIGWIEHRHGRVIEGSSSFFADNILPIIYLVGSVFLIIGIFLLIIFLRRKKVVTISPTVKKNVLMIAKKPTFVQYLLTDTNTSLDACFIEIGFSVSIAKDNQAIRTALNHSSPDVVLVDWKFDRSILTSLERLFATYPGSERILFIIYNVPDPSIMRPSRILPNMSYLGTMFTDRDIFKIVTPLIVIENNRNMQKSVQSSALEGEIGDGNLLEILQFIEIGSKSGCLLVENDQPFGLIYFNEGRIIYAATSKGIVGRDAIFAVLDLSVGKFRFITNKKPKVASMNLTTLEVLMEWTKAVDEAHGD